MLGQTSFPQPGIGTHARPRVAVLFAHGYLGFVPAWYWARVTPLLQCVKAFSAVAFTSRQPATASVERRAVALAEAMRRSRADRVVLFGHSMGGLDARFVAARLDPQRRVSHVVTLGTPHHGTRAARIAQRLRGLDLWLMRWLDAGALEALTPAGAARFNAACPDRTDVRYLSIAGALPADAFDPRWRRKARLLEQRDGPHDGLVPLRSARWGEHCLTIAADHMQLIGHARLPGGVPPLRPPRHFVQLRRLLQLVIREAARG